MAGFRYSMLLAFLLGTAPAFSQETVQDTIHTAVQIQPQFPGGMREFYRFVQENYRTPRAAKKLSGRVIATFIVEKDGEITDIRILKDIGFGTGEELVRILKRSPKWTPGIQKGHPVRVQYSLPLSLMGEK